MGAACASVYPGLHHYLYNQRPEFRFGVHPRDDMFPEFEAAEIKKAA